VPKQFKDYDIFNIRPQTKVCNYLYRGDSRKGGYRKGIDGCYYKDLRKQTINN
jgi:hypothetical protein